MCGFLRVACIVQSIALQVETKRKHYTNKQLKYTKIFPYFSRTSYLFFVRRVLSKYPLPAENDAHRWISSSHRVATIAVNLLFGSHLKCLIRTFVHRKTMHECSTQQTHNTYQEIIVNVAYIGVYLPIAHIIYLRLYNSIDRRKTNLAVVFGFKKIQCRRCCVLFFFSLSRID